METLEAPRHEGGAVRPSTSSCSEPLAVYNSGAGRRALVDMMYLEVGGRSGCRGERDGGEKRISR